MSFDLINQDMTKKNISRSSMLLRIWAEGNGRFADQLMYMGFHYATAPRCPSQSTTRDSGAEGQAGGRRAGGQEIRTSTLGTGDQRRALQPGCRHLVAPTTRSPRPMMEKLGTEDATDSLGKEQRQKSFNSIS